MATKLLVITVVLVLCQTEGAKVPEDIGHYLNEFAVRPKIGGREIVEKIALDHGFIVKRELRSINVYILEHPEIHHRSKRSAEDHIQKLKEDERIEHVQQEVILHRVKRTITHDKQRDFSFKEVKDETRFKRVEIPNKQQRDDIYGKSVEFKDPKFKDQWYLVNKGQSDGEVGLDLNMAPVWASGFTGKGVVVTILDDGVDYRHPDLKDNFDPKASADLNDRKDLLDDPLPDTTDDENNHGTRCAGEIAAAANNGVCGVGVAPEARIGGIRILDGTVTDALEAEALRFNSHYIQIYSASWGPSDDGATMEGPRRFAMEAIQEGARLGRNGLGSIFVWATGNGGLHGDDCSCDGYVSMPETVSIGSVNDWGHSPFFTENCTSTLAVVPSGGEDYIGQEKEEGDGKVKLKVVTTDMNGGCIENFQGTSSAAPLAAGCLANVLQANPNLSYRDVQHIVVQGSRIPSADYSWTINGAGHHVSHRFGFGLMNCGNMVALAQNWDNFPEQLMCNTTKENYQLLFKNGMIEDSMYINGCPGTGSDKIDRLEHVQVYVKMSTQIRGNTVLVLISPSGTKSRLLSPRINDQFSGEWEFGFMTVHNWDESPTGKWTLEVHDSPPMPRAEQLKDLSESNYPSNKVLKLFNFFSSERKKTDQADDADSVVGYIKSWSLVIRGTHGTRHGRDDVNANRSQAAYKPSEERILQIKREEIELSKRIVVKRAQLQHTSGKMTSVDDIEEHEVMERLWDLLHDQGARTVKKRILVTKQSQSHSHSQRKEEVKAEIREVVDQLLEKMDEMDKEKEELAKRKRKQERDEADLSRREELMKDLVNMINKAQI